MRPVSLRTRGERPRVALLPVSAALASALALATLAAPASAGESATLKLPGFHPVTIDGAPPPTTGKKVPLSAGSHVVRLEPRPSMRRYFPDGGEGACRMTFDAEPGGRYRIDSRGRPIADHYFHWTASVVDARTRQPVASCVASTVPAELRGALLPEDQRHGAPDLPRDRAVRLTIGGTFHVWVDPGSEREAWAGREMDRFELRLAPGPHRLVLLPNGWSIELREARPGGVTIARAIAPGMAPPKCEAAFEGVAGAPYTVKERREMDRGRLALVEYEVVDGRSGETVGGCTIDL